MDDEVWLDELEQDVLATKRRQLLAILREHDMSEVTCVDVDRCTDPLGQLSNAALTARCTAIFSIPPSLFDDEDYDDAC